MSKSYKQAIDFLAVLSQEDAVNVCRCIAKTNPSVFNGGCMTAGVGNGNLDMELKELVNSGEKITAIKVCRNMTGMGLKEAKEYVERLA